MTRGFSSTALSRRGLLKAAGLSAGLVTVGATLGAGAADAAVTVQSGWRYCSYCHGLWWPSSGHNVCFGRAGGHSRGSWSYKMYAYDYSLGSSYGWQPGWYWCSRCGLMHYGSGTSGYCAAGGSHTSSGSAQYGMAHEGFTTLDSYPYQFGWRYCVGCRGIWWPSGADGSCPAYGVHYPSGYDYALAYYG